MALGRYQAKRRFGRTPEPPPLVKPSSGELAFVVQKHWASRLHYDFRLELDGVLLSWALPKGPTYDPREKRLAVHVEDHPVDYAAFEGVIPPRQYGAGTVIVWDRGRWTPVGDPQRGLADGKLIFDLHGQKLAGRWELVRIAKPGDKQEPWMLFKKRDAWARPSTEYDVISALPDSVIAKPLPPLVSPLVSPESAPAGLEAAVPAALPATLVPQLATAATAVPAQGRWLLEPKWDGYRLLARVAAGKVKLFTRNGHDWTLKLRSLAQALQAMKWPDAWLDGEIVVVDDEGVPDFNALQNAIDHGTRGERIHYFLFDLPYAEGLDLRAVPLTARRARLQALLAERASERVRFSADFEAPPAQLLEAARQLRLEGIVAKRADSPYVSVRSETWLKLKGTRRQEFVVVGFVDREGAAREVGSLLLAVHDDDGVLRYAGNVGTGWDSRSGRALHTQLARLEVAEPALDPKAVQPGRWSRRSAGGERWVRPEVVVEVAFGDWTPEGRVRHAVFKGLRSDKPAAEVVREPDALASGGAAAAPAARAARAAPRGVQVAGVSISHPERVIDASTGLRKIDVVRYCESVADWLLPQLADRPVSLVRAPEGIAGELFFQKHPDSRIPGLRALPPRLWPGHAALLAIDTPAALASAAQMSVLEFHTWNSRAKAIGHPDRIVFDLDPGEGVAWPQVQEGALLVRSLLELLGLKSWLKTSGGKGLHVVVPLAPRLDFDTVKAFSKAAVEHLVATIPQRFVARAGAHNRVGRIFVDYLRNGEGQTTVAAYSPRARPGLGVSMPIDWDELPRVKSGAQWTLQNAREHLSLRQADPWAAYARSRQGLAKAIQTLERVR